MALARGDDARAPLAERRSTIDPEKRRPAGWTGALDAEMPPAPEADPRRTPGAASPPRPAAAAAHRPSGGPCVAPDRRAARLDRGGRLGPPTRRPATSAARSLRCMRILVTGGAGYVGSVSVERLVEAGHEVTALDNLAPAKRRRGPRRARARHVGRRRSGLSMADAAADREIEAVLHCGARSLVGESMREPALYFRENVAAASRCSRRCATPASSGSVISSTAAVYGIPDATPIPEDAPLRPINPTARRSARSRPRPAGTRGPTARSASLRYFNVAGATERNGERHDPETHLIPNVLAAAEGADR